jgi:hypothetical protein
MGDEAQEHCGAATEQRDRAAGLVAAVARDWFLISEGVAIVADPSDRVFVPSKKLTTDNDDHTLAVEDEKLLLRLLAGLHEDETGRAVISYLKHNSLEERNARAVLARQIREGTLGGIARELLALAIDPQTPSPIPNMRPIWEIQLKSKARRHKPTWARDRLVVYFIKQWMRKNASRDGSTKEEAARAAAEQHFKLERSRIAEIWQQHKRQTRASTK